MVDQRLIHPHSEPVSTGPHPSEGMPPADDISLEAGSRLRAVCIVCISLWALMLTVNHLITPHLRLAPGQVIPWPPVADLLAIASIALSVAVYLLAPIAALRGASLLKIGIGYQVALALAIGIINQWEPQAVAGRLSWLCALILIFPSIVPAPPRFTLFGSLIVASMDPVGLLIAMARDVELPSLPLLVWTYLPNYICAALAVLPSTIIVRLRREVRRARRLGSYRLLEPIGRGGMGEVWKAEHSLLARPAAIKLIRGRGIMEAFDPVLEERFRREADAAASLRSPHTIQLYDFGISRDGRLYYVMELLDGIDLQTLVQHFGPQPAARVAHILRQACHSLAEAHAAGLVHRDIKPANLHLGRIGLEYDFLKVLDFGLVKGNHRWSRQEQPITLPELTAGTPAYMAPELTSGDPVDGRADLYALACVGYYLLTGTMVFTAETPLQLILKHLQEEPEPPSRRLGCPIPPPLEQAILNCLAKQPSERPATAQGVLETLAEGIDTWTQENARAWWESSRPTLGRASNGAPPSPSTVALLETMITNSRDSDYTRSRSSSSP